MRGLSHTALFAALLALPTRVAAGPAAVGEDVPVPGGTAAVARSLGIDPPPDRERFVAELTRLVYDIPEGKNTSTDARLRRLATFLASTRSASKTGTSPAELVPVPLSAAVWGHAIFRRPTTADGLFVAILGDRQASLLCHGLSALDDETLAFLAEHPAVLTRLYEHGASIFAAFGSALRVRKGRVIVAGGEAATPLWEAALDARADRPDRFIRELFERADGRIAYLYDTVAQLEPPNVRFALGLWIKDEGARLERFKALVTATNSAYSEWRAKALPFARPLSDTATLLARVRVDAAGAPVMASRALWARVFDADEPPAAARTSQGSADQDGLIDAAWLAETIVAREMQRRAERQDQFAFGQRTFAGADDSMRPDVIEALRAFPRIRMLMLTLERMGLTRPAGYAAAARQAQRLSSLDPNRGFTAISQFQGALALLARMARVGTLDAAGAEALVSSLVAVPLNNDGRYAGGLARWIGGTLRPALAPADTVERALLAALAGRPARTGPGAANGDAVTIVTWEGQQYRLDLAAAELRRLGRVREKQDGYSVDLAVALEGAARAIGRDGVTSEELHAAVGTLRTAAGDLPKPNGDGVASGLDPQKSVRDGIERVVKDLSKNDAANKIARAAEATEALADAVLADALLSLAYALDIGDADGTVLLAGNVARRHNFGFGPRDAEARARITWGLPKQELVPGVPWHVSGSLLGLEIGLAPLVLRRISTDHVLSAPVLTSNERETFAISVALMNPVALRDADRDAIAAAVASGRRRVSALTAGTIEAVADEIGMDGWRRRALGWVLVNEPARARSMFSMTDLVRLGGGPATAALDAWGMTAVVSTGCLCTRLVPPGRWTLWTGRPQLGLMGASVADLNLHVAVMLHELQLPAALARQVLSAAVQDFVDEVRPTDPNDWLTLVRAAQRVSRERIEDYLAAATADGPLLPETAGGASRRVP